ncbi:MAG: iron dicitrate transport regulator FecR [Rhodoferax sp.]|nr:iron dicitrate transport regulator FecR [Rhodoferax sp.]MDP3651585.1 iron dicitrate transport regulator FecR [Rhodoferax sp.]
MTQHILQGRSEQEVLWFQRRGFLQAAAAWTTLGGFEAAQAQNRSNVVQLIGDATVNGNRLSPQQAVQTGDEIKTGPQSTLIFVIGNSSFHVRQNSNLTVERGATLNAVSVLRLITGAVASVWGKGSNRQIVTPTMTAGIRGTGVYTEIFADQGGRSYFCNCYGTVDMSSGKDKTTSVSEYHQAFWGEVSPKEGRSLTPAKAINHTDQELEYLARLANQRTAWQISGKKGSKEVQSYP